MTEERLFQRLAAHGGAVEIDPGFEDRLYALLQSEMRRPERSSRPVLLLVAALFAILVVSAAVAIGSGVIDLPWVVDGSPTPNPSPAASESLVPSPTPVPQAPTWTATGSPIEARNGHTATLLLDGRVLVVGGRGAADPLASAELYDPSTGTWTATGNLIEARINHTASQLPDGRVLVAGGIGAATSEFFANILASAELYDPSTGQWTSTGAMFDIRVGHTATLLLDGAVLVAGGGSSSDGDGGPLASAELYDPGTGQWIVTGSTIGAGPGRAATLLDDGRVLVVGGVGSDADVELGGLAELYDPSAGTWSATGETAEARFNHTATLLLDGRVLVAGSGTDLTSTELYDPSPGTWSATGAMLEGRLQHTATLLSDGTVLVAGSMSGSVALPSAERYEPATGEWTATAAMSDGRLGHTATRLLDGAVLVVGGTTSVIDGGVPVPSAELYDPGSGS